MTSTKFEINRNVLLQALQQSAYAVMTYKEYNSRSGWADAFRSYVFKVEADQMAILTSNGEIFMSVTISVGNPDGATATFALFAPQLLKAVKTLEDQQLTFEVYEYQVVVRHSIGALHYLCRRVQPSLWNAPSPPSMKPGPKSMKWKHQVCFRY